MQCVNCQFENMPGSRNCARCGTLMEMASHAIDVHPPRARRWVKPVRTLTRRRYAVTNRVHNALESLRPLNLRGFPNVTGLTWDMVIRLLVPGWSQFYLRRPGRGFAFLIGAFLGALVGIVFIGTTWGNIGFGFMFSMHAASVSDAVAPPGINLRGSIQGGIMVYVALLLLLYGPAYFVITHFTTPYYVEQQFSPLFAVGDVLHVRRFSYPQRGQVVLYQQQPFQLQVGNVGYMARYIRVNGGPAIERVLALSGDHVQSAGGTLLVNGSPVSYRPLSAAQLPPFELTVPSGQCLIWPYVNGGIGDSWREVALIRTDTITGAVYFRSSPWSRFGAIR